MSSSKVIPFNRTIIVSVLLATSFVAVLNQTLLIVAIPPIMLEFGVSPNQAQWVTTAYMLMNGIMIPITALLIERYGSKILLLSAISIFSIGTFIAAMAPSFIILLIARIIQAVGAGILMPLMQTVILTLYPIERRGAAMGVSGLVIGFAPAIGPTLAGFIIDQYAWRYLFYIVFPISLIVLILAYLFMKNVTEQKETSLDMLSIVLSTLGWGGLLYAFSVVGTTGWTDQTFIGAFIIGSISLVLFIWRQKRLETPILNFNVFKSRQFTIATILSVLMFAVMIGVQMLLPIFVQDIIGGTALQSGMVMLPGAILTGAMSPVAGKLFDKYGMKGLANVGFTLILTGMLLFSNVGYNTSLIYLASAFAINMLGISLLMMPLMTSGINALSFQLIAHGTAMQNTVRMVGGSVGTALIVSTMSNFSGTAEASVQGMQAGFMLGTAMAILGFIISFSLKKKDRSTDIEESKEKLLV